MEMTIKMLRAMIKESIVTEIGMSRNPYRFMVPRLDAIKKKLLTLDNGPEEAHLVEDAILHLERLLDLAE